MGEPDPDDAAQCCSPSRNASGWTIRFSDGGVYQIGDAGQAVFGFQAGDFDGNGELDIAITKPGANAGGADWDPNISVYLNHGGIFDLVAPVFVGGAPKVLSTADIDGDGRYDLAVGNYTDENPSLDVLLSNGDGTFRSTSCCKNFGIGAVPVLADFDGDGHPDLFGMIYDGTAALLLGIGDGGFSPPVPFSLGLGRDDYPLVQLAVIPWHSHDNLVLSNQNNPIGQLGVSSFDAMLGTLSYPIHYATGAPDFTYVVGVGDTNGDGMLDLAITQSNDTSVLLGLTDGGFAPFSIVPGNGNTANLGAVADLDGDGRADLVLSTNDGISVQVHYPDGGFTAPSSNILGTLSGQKVLALDYNGDGSTDLLVVNDFGAYTFLTVMTNECGD